MIEVRVEDLAFYSGDVIVRPATATLGATTPLLRRLELVAGEGVRRALRSALERVLAWQIAEVAIPPFGLGAGNLDIDESAQLMADELARHLDTGAYPTRVTLVAETPDEALALESVVARSIA